MSHKYIVHTVTNRKSNEYPPFFKNTRVEAIRLFFVFVDMELRDTSSEVDTIILFEDNNDVARVTLKDKES